MFKQIQSNDNTVNPVNKSFRTSTVPGEWLSDLREPDELNDESLEGIVGTKSVLRLPK